MDIRLIDPGVAKILQRVNRPQPKEFLRINLRLHILQDLPMDVKIANLTKPVLIILLIIVILANLLPHKDDLNPPLPLQQPAVSQQHHKIAHPKIALRIIPLFLVGFGRLLHEGEFHQDDTEVDGYFQEQGYETYRSGLFVYGKE
jgi:hypothetical protein